MNCFQIKSFVRGKTNLRNKKNCCHEPVRQSQRKVICNLQQRQKSIMNKCKFDALQMNTYIEREYSIAEALAD